MNRDELVSLVKKAISEIIGVDEKSINANTTLFADLKLESIDVVDLIFEIENKLNKRVNLISLFQVSKVRNFGEKFDLTLDEIIKFIESSN